MLYFKSSFFLKMIVQDYSSLSRQIYFEEQYLLVLNFQCYPTTAIAVVIAVVIDDDYGE